MASASNSTTLNPYSYTLTASFNENSTSTANNTSNVTCTATLSANGSYWSTGYESTLTIYWHDNRENYDRWVASISFAGLGGAWDSKSCSGTIDVTHKDDGSLSGYAYAVFSKGSTTSGYAPNSGSVNNGWTALTNIARASTPSIDGTIYTGTSVTVKTNRASNSFTHTLTYSFGSKTGTIGSSVGDSTPWSIPANFAEEVTIGNKGTCTITCDTYNGSTKIGTKTYTKDIYVNTSVVPTVSSVTQVDGNTTIKNLNWGVYLLNKSYPVLTINASGVSGSTINTYYAALNPASDADADTNAISGTTIEELNSKVRNFQLIAGTNTIKVWVKDTREYKSTKTSLSIIVRAYSSPTLTLNVARCKSASDLTEDDEGTKVKLSASGSITDVKNSSNTSKNTMYAKTRFRTSPSGTWSSLTDLSGGVSGYSFDKTGSNSVNLAGDFPTTSKYDIELYVYDTVTLAESGWSGSGTPTAAQLAKLPMVQKSILTGFDLMHFHKSGKSAAFGKKSEAGDNDKWFEVRMDDIRFEGDVYVNGVPLDTIPIGTILPYSDTAIPSGYMICDGRAISRTLYSDLFDIIGTKYGEGDGSTTFNIPDLKGKVPVGYDSGDSSFDTIGETGGEKTHTLTVDEIPAHKHQINTNNDDWNNSSGGGKFGTTYDGNSGWANNNWYTENAGGGQAHNNLQPYVTITYMIKVAIGNATVPTEVTVTNADVLQINQNKNDITTNTANIQANTEKISLHENFIEIGRSARYTYTSTAWQNHIINYDKTVNSNGSLLTRNGNKIVIGPGVKYVLVLCNRVDSIPSSLAEWDSGVIKNGTERCGHRYMASNSSLLTHSIMVTIPVEEGDYLQHYSNGGYSGSVTLYETSSMIVMALA